MLHGFSWFHSFLVWIFSLFSRQYISILRPPITDNGAPGAEIIDKVEWKQVSYWTKLNLFWKAYTLARRISWRAHTWLVYLILNTFDKQINHTRVCATVNFRLNFNSVHLLMLLSHDIYRFLIFYGATHNTMMAASRTVFVEPEHISVQMSPRNFFKNINWNFWFDHMNANTMATKLCTVER